LLMSEFCSLLPSSFVTQKKKSSCGLTNVFLLVLPALNFWLSRIRSIRQRAIRILQSGFLLVWRISASMCVLGCRLSLTTA
jgi:hypothetical protein